MVNLNFFMNFLLFYKRTEFQKRNKINCIQCSILFSKLFYPFACNKQKKMTLKNLSKSTITKIVNKKVNYIADVDTETRYFVDSIIEYFQVVKVSQNKY